MATFDQFGATVVPDQGDQTGPSTILTSTVFKKTVDGRFLLLHEGQSKVEGRRNDVEEVRSLVFHAFFFLILPFLSFVFLGWRCGVVLV